MSLISLWCQSESELLSTWGPESKSPYVHVSKSTRELISPLAKYNGVCQSMSLSVHDSMSLSVHDFMIPRLS